MGRYDGGYDLVYRATTVWRNGKRGALWVGKYMEVEMATSSLLF
jgi:hypothetical protein